MHEYIRICLVMSGKKLIATPFVFLTGCGYLELIAIIFRGGLRMRKLMGVLMAVAFVAMIGTASADDMVPGAYGQVDQSLMSPRTSGPAFRTQMQIGAADRVATSRVNIGSGAGRSLSNAGNGGGADFQWGQSQTEQSWKKAKTVEEAQVRGLVPGDCGGENTTSAYRSQMNQNRKGYLSEPVISNAQ